MTTAMLREITERASWLADGHLQSIYFGGGTPSLLSDAELEKLMNRLAEHFSWGNSAEVTLEANPDDISSAALKGWKALGINRLSIGLQSFNDEELRWMNRAHTAEESLASVKRAQDAGFDNISIDLIYGSRFQSQQTWEQTLRTAVELNTSHISSYNLTIEDKTALGLHHRKGKEPAVDDQLSAEQFLLMLDVLETAGFVGYEISNFGKPGRFAVHNTNYWLQQPYLGIGPSAHSFNGESRQWNLKNNPLYMKALEENTPFFEKELLTAADRYNEYVLTRLRTIWGCEPAEIAAQFGESGRLYFEKQLSTVAPGLLLINDTGIVTLSREGRLQADGIAAQLFM